MREAKKGGPLATLVFVLAASAGLVGCGTGHEQTSDLDAYASLECKGTSGFRPCARAHYREALERDGGALRTWRWNTQGPRVLQSQVTTEREDHVVRRAVAIINRSMPHDRKIEIYRLRYASSGRIDGTELVDGTWPNSRASSEGYIWVGLVERPAGSDDVGGYGGYRLAPTGAQPDIVRGVAVAYELDDSTDEGLVDVMVHEILHALGINGHPQEVHTSLMSYEYDDSGILDNLPLIDAAMLHEMYGWGNWRSRDWWMRDSAGAVTFGARVIDNRHVIPFVEAKYAWEPPSDKLKGTAQFNGSFLGFDGPWRAATSRVEIALDLTGEYAGEITFDAWKTKARNADWNTATDEPWHWRYGLTMDGHWFQSVNVRNSTSYENPDADGNGAPDVTGAVYSNRGHDVDVAAGTLERGTVVGGFGATKQED